MRMDCTFILILLCFLTAACRPALSHGDGHEEQHEEDGGLSMKFGFGGVSCKALGRSGKIMCVRPHKGEKGDFTDGNKDRILIEFDSLQERSKSGNTVGKVGRKGHAFNSFAQQEFKFTPMSEGKYQGLRVENFNFSSTLSAHNASLTIMAYMFDESGNITFGNETSEMRKGMLKFNIQLENWKFCSNGWEEDCETGDEGEFVDVSLVIKSKSKPAPITDEEQDVKMLSQPINPTDKKKRHPRCFKKTNYSRCPKQFDIGGGSEMVLSSQVMVDNEIREMPGNGDYPKFMEKENKQKFIFRFPKAASKILYDPGLEVGEDSSAAINFVSLTLGLLICFAFLFVF